VSGGDLPGAAHDDRGAKVGLLWMLLGTACFVAMTAFVKLLREDGMSTHEVMFWRVAPGLPWVWAELRVRKQRVWPTAIGPIAARSLFGLGAMACYFYALRALSLIEYTVLSLLQPVLVAMLAPALLHERLRLQAVVALVVALLGALIVLLPDHTGPVRLELIPVVVGIAATLFSALAHIHVRKATSTDSPERVVFWFTLVVSVFALAGGLIRGDFVAGFPAQLGLGEGLLKIAGAAGFGLAGQLFMTRAYGRAAAPMVAIVAYSAIPASIGVDLLVWGLRPGLAEIAGSVLMIGAGVVLVRGRRV
jgi:drug/metabolite transporter (DMT)-like permease